MPRTARLDIPGVCEEEPYLLELVRYIHLNPLRAGLVKDLSELDLYSWSGHAVLMGNRQLEGQEQSEILQRFGKNVNKARPISEARGIVAYLAVFELGLKGIAVGKALGLTSSGVSIAVQR